MNEEMRFLENVIGSVERGNESAVGLLRAICRKAADRAPANDLVRIAKCLSELRRDAARAHTAKN
jgi:hypothetical protein